MYAKISKSIEERLDEIRMSGHDRLNAKAQLARAEAVADALGAMAGALRRLQRTLVIKPYRRFIASFN